MALAVILGLGAEFWFHGVVRTMRETVNFHTKDFLIALIVGAVVPTILSLTIIVAKKMCRPGDELPTTPIIACFALSLLAGSLMSEIWIVRDEALFAAEASKTNAGKPYSRARAWPHQGCSLVFRPGIGIHSTD